jgi:hypothetical protein
MEILTTPSFWVYRLFDEGTNLAAVECARVFPLPAHPGTYVALQTKSRISENAVITTANHDHLDQR